MTTRTESITKCRACGAPIIWARTENEKHIPLDAEPVMRFVVDRGVARRRWTYETHFTTCPNANEFRKGA